MSKLWDAVGPWVLVILLGGGMGLSLCVGMGIPVGW